MQNKDVNLSVNGQLGDGKILFGKISHHLHSEIREIFENKNSSFHSGQ